MKKFLLIVVSLLLLLTLLVFVVSARDPLRTNQRRAWKENSILELSRRTSEAGWPTRELASLKQEPTGGAGGYETWLSDRLILMANGEWLAYANTCRKEDSAIYDFFLARGPDGNW